MAIRARRGNAGHLAFLSLCRFFFRKERPCGDTYVDLFPLADVSDEARQSQQPDEREELGEAQDAERTARVQDLEALRILLRTKRRWKSS